MPNFSLYLPAHILKALDEQRKAPRSKVITKVLESCLMSKDYISSIKLGGKTPVLLHKV